MARLSTYSKSWHRGGFDIYQHTDTKRMMVLTLPNLVSLRGFVRNMRDLGYKPHNKHSNLMDCIKELQNRGQSVDTGSAAL